MEPKLMTYAAIQGTFADVKTVKTRSVAQLIIELPIENINDALNKLGGYPQPGKEPWVAVAVLDVQRGSTEKTPQHDLVKSAGALAKDSIFQKYAMAKDENEAAEYIRFECNVKSRNEFGTDENAGKRFKHLYALFKEWEGREAA